MTVPNKPLNIDLPGPDHYHVSKQYYDIVHDVVARHPSSGDQNFSNKLLRYYLGTNRKGMRLVNEIDQQLHQFGLTIKETRFLDLGCGNGGSLVGAIECGACYCEGWDINASKREMTKLNIDTLYGSSHSIKILNISIDEPLKQETGFSPFDIVFCQEVLEHVKNIDQSLQVINQCLHPVQGCAYISIPNGYSINSVMSDPHIQVFGITLLERHEAQPLATAIKNHLHYAEMMGSYLRYDDYISLFERNALCCIPRPGTLPIKANLHETVKKFDTLTKICNECLSTWQNKVSVDALSLLAQETQKYLDDVQERLEALDGLGPKDALSLNFARDFEKDVFEFFVYHPGGRFDSCVRKNG